jgi:autotransporter-associated beta strand protein
MMAAGPALATSSLWAGAEDNDFANKNNWSPVWTMPPAAPMLETGTFAGDAATITNPVLNSSITITALNFQSTGWVLGGSGVLGLNWNNGITINASAITSGTITINHGLEVITNQSWTIGNGDASTSLLNIYGDLSGAGNLTFGGRGGQINLYGSAASYTGTLTLNGYANIGLARADALGSGTLINNGASLINLNDSPLTLANDMVLNAGWNYGRLATWGGDTPRDSTLILTGNILADKSNQVAVQSGTLVIAGSISGTGLFGRGTYSQSGALVLAGDNRGFSGTMTFNQGNPLSGIPSAASANYLNSAYAFGNSQLVQFLGSAIVLDNTSGSAVRIATSNSLQFSYNTQFIGTDDLDLGDGTVQLTANHNFNVLQKTLALGTLITHPNHYQLIKYGAGNLVFNGDATVSDKQMLIIKEGLLAIKGNLDIQTSSTSVGRVRLDYGQLGANGTLTGTTFFSGESGTAGGTAVGFAAYGGDLTLNFGGSGSTQVWGNNNIAFMGGGNRTLLLGHAISDGTVEIQNGIALQNNWLHTVQAARGDGTAKIDARLSGTISGGNVNTTLSKTGDGVLELAGDNVYTGTTAVSAGVLLVSGSTSGQGAFTVSAGATLGGHGVIGTANKNVTISGVLDVSGGGALDTPGTLTLNLGTGALDLTDVQLLGFTLGADGISDQIQLGAGTTLTLGGLTFEQFVFTLSAGFTGAGTYDLFTGDAGWLPSFSELTGSVSGYDATLGLNSLGTALTLTVIPEPSALMLLVSGAALLFIVRRRQR